MDPNDMVEIKELSVAEVIEAWVAHVDRRIAKNPDAAKQTFLLTDTAIRLLAEGRPVSARQLAAATGLTAKFVSAAFREMAKQGGEFDADGRLLGAALTQVPTPHQFQVNGQTLYTWCSLDAIFLPGLLGQEAAVRSICPTTSATIRLTVTPAGVSAVTLPSTVLSIAVPGLTCSTGQEGCANEQTGAQRDGCNQMHFFRDRAAAQAWTANHPGVAIFTISEAWQLAETNWLGRRRSATHSGSAVGPTADPESCC